MRVDGKPAVGLPPVVVKVNPVLPPGQVEPNKLEIDPSPWLGGYCLLQQVLGILWFVGLVGIVLSFFFPRRKERALAVGKPVTLDGGFAKPASADEVLKQVKPYIASN